LLGGYSEDWGKEVGGRGGGEFIVGDFSSMSSSLIFNCGNRIMYNKNE